MPDLNQQAPFGPDRRDDGSLLVHSIFPTIQGEGPFAGWPAIFIRLFGCNLQCPWCDTDYTSVNKLMEPRDILAALRALDGYPLVVITGGEPFRQNIAPLADLLLAEGYLLQIETNGTLHISGSFWFHEQCMVVCSPKTPKIHPATSRQVHCYKYVLAHDSIANDGLPGTVLGHLAGPDSAPVARPPVGWQGPVYLQPMDAKDDDVNWRNIRAVVTQVMKHKNYIMGVQMHKLTGLP